MGPEVTTAYDGFTPNRTADRTRVFDATTDDGSILGTQQRAMARHFLVLEGNALVTAPHSLAPEKFPKRSLTKSNESKVQVTTTDLELIDVRLSTSRPVVCDRGGGTSSNDNSRARGSLLALASWFSKKSSVYIKLSLHRQILSFNHSRRINPIVATSDEPIEKTKDEAVDAYIRRDSQLYPSR